MSVDDLNNQFSLGRYLNFREGPNGFVYAKINNDSGSARIYIHGAHVTSFAPTGQEPVIFLSDQSLYEEGKAIRGGIPISWPWFADHPTDSTKPAHGFARTSLWEVAGANHVSTDETEIIFVLKDSKESLEIWNHNFELELKLIVGKELNFILKMTNTDNEEYSITSAFHTYYNVADVRNITILGLENTNYIDKVDGYTKKLQQQELTMSEETDRIYLDTAKECIIEDLLFNRKIKINKIGSNSTVIWNPWIQKSQQMKDLSDDGYINFICIETTNAGPDLIKLEPGEVHELGLNISIESR